MDNPVQGIESRTKLQQALMQRTVLVVDDEPFVLKTTAVILTGMGFRNVITAGSVDEALSNLDSCNGEIELILTDLNMPGADGIDLLRQLDERCYPGDVILFSGEDQQTLKMAESLARARQLAVIGSISKPVNREVLSGILARHVEQERHSGGKVVTRTVGELTRNMLEEAILTEQIEPWFQPKICVKTRQPVGVEMLARWPLTPFGMVMPDQFIPLAESEGLIDSLTCMLIKKAVETGCQWHKQGINLKIAVNVSMDSLQALDFPERLEQLVTEAGGDMKSLQIEVTESRLMEDLVCPLDVLLRLRLKKINLSIDDFGTGHSNLTQLRDLPFDELKLDRSFLQMVSSSNRAAAILESSVEIARKLGMKLVAEGVETFKDWQLVESLGCDQVQGWFVARAMPADEVPIWFENWPQLFARLFDGAR